jgi:hypothetical protein
MFMVSPGLGVRMGNPLAAPIHEGFPPVCNANIDSMIIVILLVFMFMLLSAEKSFSFSQIISFFKKRIKEFSTVRLSC